MKRGGTFIGDQAASRMRSATIPRGQCKAMAAGVGWKPFRLRRERGLQVMLRSSSKHRQKRDADS